MIVVSLPLLVAAPVLINTSFPEQANRGDAVMLSCTFSGYPIPTINWRRDGSVIPPSSRIAILSSNTSGNLGNLVHSSIIITDLRLSDSGTYTCLSFNHLVSTQQLSFTGSLAVYGQLLSNRIPTRV